MTAFSEKVGKVLLFALGSFWGYLWVQELLSCPEWWFAGTNALLIGSGIYVISKIPENCRRWPTALLLMAMFVLPASDLRSVLLPFLFGLWYGGEKEVFGDWRISRIFCGGWFLGGVFSGISWLLPFWNEWRLWFIPLLVTLVLLNSVPRKKWYQLGMLLLGVLFAIFSVPESKNKPEWMDSGTVLAAFALVEPDAEVQRPVRISFIGERETIYQRSLAELFLDLVSEVNCSKLPGTVSSGTDLVIVTELPDIGDRGVSALNRALEKGALLVMPSCYWGLFPGAQWYILPGSDGKYAVSAHRGELELDPDKMDRQLAYHFRGVKNTSIAPMPGAFAGMLTGFNPECVKIDPVPEKNLYNYLISASVALLILLMIWIVRVKRPGSECFRVIINSVGYSMLAGVFLGLMFKNLPTGEHFRAILMSVALIWIFRRPVPESKKRFLFSGIVGLMSLAMAYFQNTWLLLLALFSGGYLFAVLDGELCRDRDNGIESLRFLGFAAGAFIFGILSMFGVPWYGFFATVLILRLWSYLRN
ncbi:MAG: hypothetical protein E7058_06240 [Lentisphaerae bacterium]|nr:hypothetical protein [Lentisphaerota bacterium]